MTLQHEGMVIAPVSYAFLDQDSNGTYVLPALCRQRVIEAFFRFGVARRLCIPAKLAIFAYEDPMHTSASPAQALHAEFKRFLQPVPDIVYRPAKESGRLAELENAISYAKEQGMRLNLVTSCYDVPLLKQQLEQVMWPEGFRQWFDSKRLIITDAEDVDVPWHTHLLTSLSLWIPARVKAQVRTWLSDERATKIH
jgi:hypothetical protein